MRIHVHVVGDNDNKREKNPFQSLAWPWLAIPALVCLIIVFGGLFLFNS